MRQKQRTRMAMMAGAIIAALAIGLMSVGTGIAGVTNLNDGFAVFAQNGKDKGNNGQGKDKGNNGNNGNNGQGNNGQGNGNGNHGQEADDDGDVDDAEQTEQTENTGNSVQGKPRNEKVNICHVTDAETGDTELINVSINAVPAHESHGDIIGVASADECPVAEEPTAEPTEEPTAEPTEEPIEEPTVPSATPITGDDGDDGGGDDGDDDEDDGDDDGDDGGGEATPDVGTPSATPELD